MSQRTLSEVSEALEPAFEADDPASGAKEREREHVALLARMIDLIAAGRFDRLREHLAPDVTLEIAAPPWVPWVRRAEGVDAVTDAIATNFGAVRDQRPEPLALAAQGDTILVMARESGRLADTGAPYDVVLAQQYTFRDGRLAVFRSVAAEAAHEDEEAYARAAQV